jgi:hypothetical protein
MFGVGMFFKLMARTDQTKGFVGLSARCIHPEIRKLSLQARRHDALDVGLGSC